jgi:hypothetical protein
MNGFDFVLKGEEGFDPTKMSWRGSFLRKFSGVLSFKHIQTIDFSCTYFFESPKNAGCTRPHPNVL